MLRVAVSPRRTRPLALLLVVSLLAGLGAPVPATLAAGGRAAPKPAATTSVATKPVGGKPAPAKRVGTPRATSLGGGGLPTTWYVGPGTGSGACATPDFTTGEVGDGSDDAAIQAAVDAASTGDTIFLCDNVYELTSGINLNDVVEGPTFDSLVIQGESTTGTELSGGGTVPLFAGWYHGGTWELTVRRMTLRDGSQGDAGAITAYDVTVEDARFIDNYGGFAGAIYALANLTVRGSTFIGNSSGNNGGAVQAVAHAAVMGSRFAGNSAVSGGAIRSDSLSLTDSTFIGNHAVADGGAISTAHSASVDHGTFTDNTGGSSAGAISVGGSLSVVDSHFTRNIARANQGGALYVLYGVDISSSTFVDHTSGQSGGAIFAAGRSTIEIRDTDFLGNDAPGHDGGAIYVDREGGSLTVEGGRFEDNHAQYGGAVRALANTTFRDVDFVGNSTGGNGGGALYVNLQATIEDCRFTGNSTPSDGGGAVYTENSDWGGRAALILRRTDFTDNTANQSGGAIYVEGSLDLSGGTFRRNVGSYGGAIYANGLTSSSISDATFVRNRSLSDGFGGGAIFFQGDALSISDSIFTENRAESAGAAGGAVFALTWAGSLFLHETDFARNDVPDAQRNGGFRGGGAVAVLSPLRIVGGTFEDNTTGADGGAIFARGPLDVTGATFVRNLARIDGGAIDGPQGPGRATFDAATFTDNTAGNGGGGAIFWDGAISIFGGTYRNNVAKFDGGAVVAVTVAEVFEAEFIGNRAGVDAGAIRAGELVRASGTVFSDNSAGSSGGAIFAATDLEVTAGIFTGNAAGSEGGAIRVGRSSSVSRSLFVDNTAGNSGGAISGAVPGPMRLRGNTFVRNSAITAGGAVRLAPSDPGDQRVYTIDSANDTFVANSAGEGGAIGAIGSGTLGKARVLLVHDTFVDNTAGTGPHIFAANPDNVSSGDRVVRGVLFVGGGCWALGGSVSGNVTDGGSCPGAIVDRDDLNLGDLEETAGFVPTIALGKGSAAIDPFDGDYLSCTDGTGVRLATDARGGARLAYGTCDAGAFEYQGPSERPTSIRISATVDGVEIADGAEVTSGSSVVVHAWVTAQNEADATAGIVVFRACESAFALPASCEGGPAGFFTYAQEGTSGTDGIGEATWYFTAGHGYLRLAADYRVRGGIIGAAEVTSGTPGFLMARRARIFWDATAGVAVRSGGTSAVVRARTYAIDGGAESGCTVGFTFNGTTTEVVSGALGVASTTISGLASPGVNVVSITTGDGCPSAPFAAIVTNGPTSFPRGTVGTVAGGWYIADASPGAPARYASIGLRVESTSGTVGKGRTAVTTVRTRIAFAWVASNGWRITATATDVTTATGSTPVSPWRRTTCPASVSDGTSPATTLPRGTLCGQFTFQGTVSEWSSGTKSWTDRGTQTFMVEVADGGSARKVDATDWIALRSASGGFGAIPTSFLRPMRDGYTTGAYLGRAFVY